MNIEIIAELAQGYEGSPEQARLLLKAAAASGADAAKFQVIYADELATPDYKHYELFRSLEMADEAWQDLARSARDLRCQLQLDIFGKKSLRLAEEIGVTAVKLHPTDVSNIGLLNEVARSSVSRVLLGAGGAYASVIQRAMTLLSRKETIILLGFQGYPTPNDSNQIARVRLMVERFVRTLPNVKVGFADHAPPDGSLCVALAATAVGAGAQVIEKHLTLGRVMKLEDHESALNPDDFSEFSRVLRGCAQALGEADRTEDFGMSAAEQEYRKSIRRHVVARHDLRKGNVLSDDDLVLKRTSAVDAVADLDLAYEKVLTQDHRGNTPILNDDLDRSFPSARRRLVAAIACRMQGSRLLGKPLQNLDVEKGTRILDNIISCLRTLRCIDEIVLGISEGPENEIFQDFAEQNGLRYIIGDQTDVLSRLVLCGKLAEATDVFRVTSESPFLYFEPVAELWEHHQSEGADATFLDEIIDGCGFEIIRLKALEDSHTKGEKRHRSELCSLYIRENHENYRIIRANPPTELTRKNLRLTVDNPEDLAVCRVVYAAFKASAPRIPVGEVVKFLDAHPKLIELLAPFTEAGYSTMYR